jgi:Flp pilus assembly protein TadG
MTAFLMLMFAIMNMATAVYAYNWVSYSAREATRYASVHGSTSSSPVGPSSYSALTSVVTNIENGLTGTVTVTPTWSSNSNVPGNTVNVKVQYKFSFMMPFMSLSPITMSSTSQMVIDR